jgi:DNA-directed RNA polymerase II subunit RPB3
MNNILTPFANENYPNFTQPLILTIDNKFFISNDIPFDKSIDLLDNESFICHEDNIEKINDIRRKILRDVETLAIDEISINENTTDIPDEIICLRLGLLIIKTSIEMMQNFNQKKLYHINVENREGFITSDDITSSNPMLENMESNDLNFDDTFNIVKIYPEQRLSCSFNVKKSSGKEHAKWSPVSSVSYVKQGKDYLFNLELIGNLSLDSILKQLENIYSKK